MACIFIAVMLYVPLLYADPYTQDKTIKPYEIILKEFENSNGGLGGAAQGTLASQPQYLFVKGLSVLRAIEVILTPLTKGDSFKLDVVKENWHKPVQSCEAKAGKSCLVAFKTYDDAGFIISGNSNSSWQLAVFTSPELDVSEILPSPIYTAKKSDADKLSKGAVTIEPIITEPTASSSNSLLLMIIIALLVIIAAILFVFLFKRNKGTIAGLLLLAFLGSSPDGEADGLFPSPGSIDRADVEAALDTLEDTGIDDGRLKALLSLKKLANSWEDLSSCSNMSNRPGTPRIPSFCEDNEDCTECYKEARDDFNLVRSVSEQLRIIYKCTTDFADDAIAFGDNVSGVHAVSGLAWQAERVEIKKSVKKLQGSYDKKYTELMNSLEISMQKMNSCEAQWGVPDWYDRFGFIYVEFMKDKYKRND